MPYLSETSNPHFFVYSLSDPPQTIGFFDDMDVCLAHITDYHRENHGSFEMGETEELNENDLDFLGYEAVMGVPGCTACFCVTLGYETYQIVAVGKKSSSHPGSCRSVTHDWDC